MLLIVSFNFFNYFFVCLFEVLHPRHGLDSSTFAIAQPRAPLPAGQWGWGPGGGSPQGPFCFSLPPSPGGGWTRGSTRVGRGLRLSRL